MEKRIAIVGNQEVEVTVCPSALSPRERKMMGLGRAAKPYRTQKEKSERLAAKGLTQSMKLDAYELAVRFGVEQKSITESEFLHQNARTPEKRVAPVKHDTDPMWFIK
ncbi:hypothetical protein ACLHZT_03270 [Aeromonas veronii]|uniref:hypothetical protein n=1 Tax=Aeromonas veronii TaxID=654 RepID=UPI003D0499A2